eukprot:778177-Prorocentrum_minimum.AAC.2
MERVSQARVIRQIRPGVVIRKGSRAVAPRWKRIRAMKPMAVIGMPWNNNRLVSDCSHILLIRSPEARTGPGLVFEFERFLFKIKYFLTECAHEFFAESLRIYNSKFWRVSLLPRQQQNLLSCCPLRHLNTHSHTTVLASFFRVEHSSFPSGAQERGFKDLICANPFEHAFLCMNGLRARTRVVTDLGDLSVFQVEVPRAPQVPRVAVDISRDLQLGDAGYDVTVMQSEVLKMQPTGFDTHVMNESISGATAPTIASFPLASS